MDMPEVYEKGSASPVFVMQEKRECYLKIHLSHIKTFKSPLIIFLSRNEKINLRKPPRSGKFSYCIGCSFY